MKSIAKVLIFAAAGAGLLVGGFAISGTWSSKAVSDANMPILVGGFLAASILLVLGLRMLGTDKYSKPAAEVALESATNRNWAPLPGHPDLQWRHIEPHQAGKHHHPGSLAVRVTLRRELDIKIAPETGFDRISKRWGLSHEVQLGDQTLDRALYLRGSFDYQLTRALQADDAKQALRQLLDQGYSQVDITPGDQQLTCQRAPFAGTVADEQAKLQIVAHALRKLHQVLPQKGPRYGVSIAAVGLTMFLLLFGALIFFITPYKPVDGRDLLLLTLSMSVVSYLAFVWLSGFLLRGRSRSHDTWSIFAMFAMMAIPMGSYGGLVLANAKLDRSVGQARTVPVTDKKEGRRKRKSYYTIYFTDPRGGGKILSIKVSADEYAGITPGQSQVQGKLHQGYLGVPWWSEFAVVAKPTNVKPERP